MQWRTFIFLLLVAVLLVLAVIFVMRSFERPATLSYSGKPRNSFWAFQAIDTMKYSRDLAREKANDRTFDEVIETQTKNIAETGATHIAIATPYDEEFVPFLRRWVTAARAHGLHVWFRGNFSGWERWFGYSSITPEEHVQKTRAFILAHSDLFESGDAFSGCPECENGGRGDPRRTGETVAFRSFLIQEKQTAETAFRGFGKDVRTDLFSMNGDVARLVMDPATTEALGGVVTVDHYVPTPEQLVRDVKLFSDGGKRQVVLGEFGAPIPDLNGVMTEAEQAKWLETTLQGLLHEKNLAGLSYWLANGGSTELWDKNGNARQAVGILKKYFKPMVITGYMEDELGRTLPNVTVSYETFTTTTDDRGYFVLRFIPGKTGDLSVRAPHYKEGVIALDKLSSRDAHIVLKEEAPSVLYRVRLFFHEKHIF